MFLILTIVLIVALVGSLPTWPHSKSWGYYPSGGLGLLVVILLIQKVILMKAELIMQFQKFPPVCAEIRFLNK